MQSEWHNESDYRQPIDREPQFERGGMVDKEVLDDVPNGGRYDWMGIGIVLVMIPSHLSALAVSGVAFSFFQSMWTGSIISLVGGFVGGWILVPECRFAGVMGGMTSAICLFAINVSSLRGIESVLEIPWPGYSPLILLGLIPGVGVAVIIQKLAREKALPTVNKDRFD